MTTDGITVEPTTYTVTALPPDDPRADVYALKVMRVDTSDQWTVTRWGAHYYPDGRSEVLPAYGLSKKERRDQLAAVSYPFDAAMALARRLAPTVTIPEDHHA